MKATVLSDEAILGSAGYVFDKARAILTLDCFYLMGVVQELFVMPDVLKYEGVVHGNGHHE